MHSSSRDNNGTRDSFIDDGVRLDRFLVKDGNESKYDNDSSILSRQTTRECCSWRSRSATSWTSLVFRRAWSYIVLEVFRSPRAKSTCVRRSSVSVRRVLSSFSRESTSERPRCREASTMEGLPRSQSIWSSSSSRESNHESKEKRVFFTCLEVKGRLSFTGRGEDIVADWKSEVVNKPTRDQLIPFFPRFQLVSGCQILVIRNSLTN